MSQELNNNVNTIFTEMLDNISFYSPIAVTFGILMLSISISTPIKGVIYIAWVLISTFFRIMTLLMISSGDTPSSVNSKCNKGGLPGILAKFDEGRNSIYLLSFTLFYMCFPMFISGNVNWYFIWLLVAYTAFDVIIKYKNQCVSNSIIILGEVLGGSMFGLSVSGLMYYLGLSKYLFVNNLASNKEVCSMPKKQTFKCAVYKNGEMISSVNT